MRESVIVDAQSNTRLERSVGLVPCFKKNMWKCPNCSEEVEEHFGQCWNCQSDKSGNLTRIDYSSDKETQEAEQVAFLNEKHRPKNCLRCNLPLSHVGRKEFHEGIKLGALGDFAELFVSQTRLEMYVCPTCHHVEFFLSDPM